MFAERQKTAALTAKAGKWYNLSEYKSVSELVNTLDTYLINYLLS